MVVVLVVVDALVVPVDRVDPDQCVVGAVNKNYIGLIVVQKNIVVVGIVVVVDDMVAIDNWMVVVPDIVVARKEVPVDKALASADTMALVDYAPKMVVAAAAAAAADSRAVGRKEVANPGAADIVGVAPDIDRMMLHDTICDCLPNFPFRYRECFV